MKGQAGISNRESRIANLKNGNSPYRKFHSWEGLGVGSSLCLCIFMFLCLCACLCTTAFSAVTEDADMNMGLGTHTTATTIIEITGHMLGADSLPEGYILATVFHDTDGNGTISQDEKGMKGVALRIKNKTATTTTTGQVIFQDFLPAGTYTISLDINTVPIEYICTVPLEQSVVISSDGTASVEFPLQLSSKIEGLVFIDENRNGLPDPGEQGVRDAIIHANDCLTVTSYDGCYRFSGMLSGKYTLKLDMGSITDAGYQDYEPTTINTMNVGLQQGQRLRRVNFGIAKREKEIEFE